MKQYKLIWKSLLGFVYSLYNCSKAASASLKPVYTPSGEGQLERMLVTIQAGKTLLLSLPRLSPFRIHSEAKTVTTTVDLPQQPVGEYLQFEITMWGGRHDNCQMWMDMCVLWLFQGLLGPAAVLHESAQVDHRVVLV